MTDILLVLVGAVACVPLLVGVILVYARAAKRAQDAWSFVEAIPDPAGGAYRGAVLHVARTPGPPTAVLSASLGSLLMLLPAALSLPIVYLGLSDGAVPAMVFGPLGLLLTAFVVRAGYKLLEPAPRAADRAHSVAQVEIVYDLVVVLTVVTATVTENPTWKLWRADRLGAVALAYALVSLVHACWTFHAVDEHRLRLGRGIPARGTTA
jgi:hypothetical protein